MGIQWKGSLFWITAELIIFIPLAHTGRGGGIWAMAGSTPGWVTGSSQGSMCPFGGSVPCSVLWSFPDYQKTLYDFSALGFEPRTLNFSVEWDRVFLSVWAKALDQAANPGQELKWVMAALASQQIWWLCRSCSWSFLEKQGGWYPGHRWRRTCNVVTALPLPICASPAM